MSTRSLSGAFVVLWTSGYVVGALAIEVAGPLPLLESRFLIAALVAVPIAVRRGHWRHAPVRQLVGVGLLLQVAQFGGAYGGFAAGVPAGVSALVMLGFSPLLTTALAIGLGQERSHPRVWGGLAIGAGGVVLGLVPDLSGAHLGIGLGLVTVGMLGFVGGTVLQKRVPDDVDPWTSLAVQSLTAAVVLAPATAIVGGRYELGLHLLLTIGWLGLGMALLSLFVLIRLLGRTSASRVSTLLQLVPALTAVASAPVLGEAIHPLTLVGMAVAGGGVATALTGGSRRRDRSAARRRRDPRPRQDRAAC